MSSFAVRQVNGRLYLDKRPRSPVFNSVGVPGNLAGSSLAGEVRVNLLDVWRGEDR